MNTLFFNPFYLLLTVGGVGWTMFIIYLYLLLHNVEERLQELEKETN